jgi:hypothetical protein
MPKDQPLQQLDLHHSLGESVSQRVVLLLEVPLTGARSIAALQRSLHARERRVPPADNGLRADSKAPGDLVDGRLALQIVQNGALAGLAAASARASTLAAMLLDPFIGP